MSSEEAFAQKITDTITHGFTAAGLSVGLRLGLFDGLAALSQSKGAAVTTTQLANHLNYKERYVREWINAMVCADVVDHVEVDGKDLYWLSPYRLSSLVGLGCTATSSELLTGSTNNSRNVEKCFALDGPPGTNVDEYPGLHEFLAKRPTPWSQPSNVKRLLNDESLVEKLESGIKVLEMGCGAAVPIKAMATVFPNSTFVASEVSEEILDMARENCKDLSNVTYEVLDACKVSPDRQNEFGLIVLFDMLHDVPYPDQLLSGVHRLLTEGGQFLMTDLDLHGSVQQNKTQCADSGAIMYVVSSMYCMPTSVIYPGGAGLGACVGPEVLEGLLRDSGLTNVEVKSGELGQTFYASKSSSDVTECKRRKADSTA